MESRKSRPLRDANLARSTLATPTEAEARAEDGSKAKRTPGSEDETRPAEKVYLSPRMKECLTLASEGYSSADIGKLLNISGRTADDHLTKARSRLGVRTRVQAVMRAVMLKLIPPPKG